LVLLSFFDIYTLLQKLYNFGGGDFMLIPFQELEVSDQIQIISIIATIIISLVSIWIAVSTLKQTNKITEEANRPYIVVYLETIQVTSSFIQYLVVKNFGNTGAMIDSISYEPEFKNKYDLRPFEEFKNHFIAPNQSITCVCGFEFPCEPIIFRINYHQDKNFYSESFTINPNALAKLINSRASNSKMSELEKLSLMLLKN